MTFNASGLNWIKNSHKVRSERNTDKFRLSFIDDGKVLCTHYPNPIVANHLLDLESEVCVAMSDDTKHFYIVNASIAPIGLQKLDLRTRSGKGCRTANKYLHTYHKDLGELKKQTSEHIWTLEWDDVRIEERKAIIITLPSRVNIFTPGLQRVS